jgi:hypothetical protein
MRFRTTAQGRQLGRIEAAAARIERDQRDSALAAQADNVAVTGALGRLSEAVATLTQTVVALRAAQDPAQTSNAPEKPAPEVTVPRKTRTRPAARGALSASYSGQSRPRRR